MNKRFVWFVVAVVAQLFILAAVPAQKIHTLATGKTVILKTFPVDPYSVMSGYYVMLGYEISNPKVSTDWEKWSQGTPVWVLLKTDPNGFWDAVSVHDKKPAVPSDCVVIRGRKSHWRIEYGIESYFIPEDAREKITLDFRNHSKEAKVEAKIDASGRAAIIKLIIQDRIYNY
jgi:uncharacterized membrane-anchored protein